MTEKKPAQCKLCGAKDLTWHWDFKAKRRFLVNPKNQYGSTPIHRCKSLPKDWDEDIRPASCKYCKSTEVFWVRNGDDRYVLEESYGLPHACQESVIAKQEHSEAIRMNYAFEKKWVNSFEDGFRCKSCKSLGVKTRKRPNKRAYTISTCKKCKGVGCFTSVAKKAYLKVLRKRYWPFMPWMLTAKSKSR